MSDDDRETFQILWTDPDTSMLHVEKVTFNAYGGVSAKEWAEDHAYKVSINGNFKMFKLQDADHE